MTSTSRTLCLTSLAATALWLAASGCGSGPANSGGATADTAAVEDAATQPAAHSDRVQTARVTEGRVDSVLIASGTIVAPRTTLLGAEVSGRIASVRVDEGDPLARGEVAFVLDREPYEIDLAEAKAGLQLAQAEAAQQAQELERTRSLADQQIVAAQELDFRKTQLAVAEARVSQARARLSRAERDLERTVVRAPYASTVVERHLHEGANLAGPSSVVLTIQALDGFEAQLAIPESSAVQATVGDQVALTLQGRAKPVSTTVKSVNSRIDPESRTYSVRAVVPEGLGAKSGAFVRAEISPRSESVGLVVPRSSVLRRDGKNVVFRYRDGQAERVDVEVGALGLDLAEIVSGLTAGDEVIYGDLVDRLADGSPVRRTEVTR